MDIWSMVPRLELKTPSGSLEILYSNSSWSYGNCTDADVQKLQEMIKQLEEQNKRWKERLNEVELKCKDKERAIDVILHSKKCTVVPREKRVISSFASNVQNRPAAGSLFAEVGNSAVPPPAATTYAGTASITIM